MFDYIGSKIKMLAKVMFWVGLIGSVIIGFVGIIMSAALGEALAAVEIMLLMLVGNLLNCIWCWLVYGFGQLIDNTDKLVASKEKEYEFNHFS